MPIAQRLNKWMLGFCYGIFLILLVIFSPLIAALFIMAYLLEKDEPVDQEYLYDC